MTFIVSMAALKSCVTSNSGETALLVLKEKIYNYNSQEERERLDKLGRRLSEERLLSNTSIRELIDLYDRYSNGESLNSIITSVKNPGMKVVRTTWH